MVRWLPWSRGPNYKHELPRLAEQIRRQRALVLSATTANRNWPRTFAQQTVLLYALYMVYAFLFGMRKHFTQTIVMLVSIPFLVVAGYKFISRITLRRKKHREESLELLVAKRKNLVEEFKKQTKFDEIMNLIDDSNDSKVPVGKIHPDGGKGGKATGKSGNKDGVKNRHGNSDKSPSTKNSKIPAAVDKATQEAAHSGLLGATNAPDGTLHGIDAATGREETFIPVYHSSWVDRVLDVILGINENSPAYRYALICPQCHAHNGLAPYGRAAEEVTYICRVCGHLQVGEATSDAIAASEVKAAADKDPKTDENVKEKTGDTKSLDKSAVTSAQKATSKADSGPGAAKDKKSAEAESMVEITVNPVTSESSTIESEK